MSSLKKKEKKGKEPSKAYKVFQPASLYVALLNDQCFKLVI